MKGLKTLSAIFGVAAVMFSAVASYAANTVSLGGVGSSALFNGIASASCSQVPDGFYCITSGSPFYVNDATTAVQEKGNLWVTWFGTTAGSRKIYFYLQTDSTVGNRALSNAAKLGGPGTQPAPAGTIPGCPAPVAMPDDVYTSIIGATFNGGFTDITPTDARFATQRAFALGYTAANPFKSDVSTKTFAPVAFTLPNNLVLTSIGAAPIVVFVNKSNAGAGHLGDSRVKNVNRFTLSGLLDGTFGLSADIIKESGVSGVPITVFVREELSGTYNTMEYNVPAAQEIGSTQEAGFAPGTNNVPGPGGSIRRRVIGTGEMNSTVNSTADSLGYSFWSASNFSGLTNTKYITVDGVDPVQDNYSTGAYPGTATLSHVADGSYPIWSVLRLVTIGTPNTDIKNLLGSPIPGDFILAKDLRVFRSHYTRLGVSPDNGVLSGTTESGADVGGAVFLINNEQDFFDSVGGELLEFRQ